MMFKVFRVFIMVRNEIYQTECFTTLLISGDNSINNEAFSWNIDGEEASRTTTLGSAVYKGPNYYGLSR
jgi:hypothetical protein